MVLSEGKKHTWNRYRTIKFSLCRRHVCLCNLCARAALHKHERAQKTVFSHLNLKSFARREIMQVNHYLFFFSHNLRFMTFIVPFQEKDFGTVPVFSITCMLALWHVNVIRPYYIVRIIKSLMLLINVCCLPKPLSVCLFRKLQSGNSLR